MESWKQFNPEKDYSSKDNGENDGSKCTKPNIDIKSSVEYLSKKNSSHLNGEVSEFCEVSCRPKCTVNNLKIEPHLNHLEKNSGHYHPSNCCSLSNCHDCYESQYPMYPAIDSQCFCNSISKFCSSKCNGITMQPCNRNIDSSFCDTVVCDGMESYFEENAAVILGNHSSKLLNGESNEKSTEQNNLNYETKINEAMVSNGSAYSSVNKQNNSMQTYSLCTLDADNGTVEFHNPSDDSNRVENHGRTANIMHCSYANPPRINGVSHEMDCIELDVEEHQNAVVDSDVGSDSRGSSPQPSSYDSGNDNEEVNADCLTETNSVDDEGENNDLGNNFHSVEAENRVVHSLSFQNQLSPNIVTRPTFKDDSNFQNVLVDEHSLCSDDSDHVNMEVCEARVSGKESSFNIQSEDMECEDLNFHSTLCNIEKLADKDNIFSSKPNYQSISKLSKEMDICNCKENVMIWSEKEACNLQVSQITTSAYSATAIINALLALKVPFTKEKVFAAVKTRLCDESAPLAEYLLSRSVAGATHHDLISAVHEVSDGKVYGRFFHLYPAKHIQLMQWVADFIKIGAVPVATLNVQQGVSPGDTIPDAWHHQMVFGVGPNGMYMTNPLTCVSSALLSKQLCSESVLLVKRSDVIHRWDEDGCDLTSILLNSDSRWMNGNVIGQIVNVLREAAAAPAFSHRRTLTHHITIPTAYQSGITFFIRKDSKGYHQLLHYHELS